MTGKFPLPTAAIIDPVNRCNLNCHLCPTGQKKLNYPQSFMSFETYKIILGKFPELKSLDLYNWGEPFLNPEIFDMIQYAKDKNIFVKMHTNLSLKKDDEFIISLVKHGPHWLVISLDGASQESYSRFRVHGNYELVIDNINKIKRLQNLNNAPRMVIIWKYLVNVYNEHEMARAQAIAKELGVRIRFVPMSLGDDMIDIIHHESLDERKKQWLPANKRYVLNQYLHDGSKPIFNGPCTYLFKKIIINPDGRVFPCCYITDERHVFGNIINEPLDAIWNNEKYEYSRSLFVKNEGIKYAGTTICKECGNYEKSAR
jgi:radical SAM protein with 4Fe4S-binding SPASM domain